MLSSSFGIPPRHARDKDDWAMQHEEVATCSIRMGTLLLNHHNVAFAMHCTFCLMPALQVVTGITSLHYRLALLRHEQSCNWKVDGILPQESEYTCLHVITERERERERNAWYMAVHVKRINKGSKVWIFINTIVNLVTLFVLSCIS